ncbi:MAG TPA: carboxypeptidase-like regulatory domain-containing protein [Gemmatimonadetes bacterium]|nr:carboxypeptidase-like regulatory domain-containing protein [Gemmatimonadota bacterium]
MPPGLAAQTGTVYGQVTEAQTGVPIARVQVFIFDLEIGGLTQQNGRFLLQNVPAETHALSVARIGYRPSQLQIVVVSNQSLEQNFAISTEQESPLARPRPPTYPYWFVLFR